MLFKKSCVLAAVLFISIAAPASAHNLPMGGSRWSFGSNSILGFVDLKSSLISEIKAIKEGHYDLDTVSGEQLQQIATDIIQPYVNTRLSIVVNDKTYPVRVEKLLRNENNLYTVCLSVHNVNFSRPVNDIKIAYSLLLQETNNEHVNLAFGYVSDATGAALQKVFDFSPPAFQTTFDANDTVWEVSVKGIANAPAAAAKTESPVVKSGVDSIKSPLVNKSVPSSPPASVSISENVPQKRAADNGPAGSPSSSRREAASHDPENHSLSASAAKRSVGATLRQFVPLGIEHILTGYDHIAFLLAIVVIELSIREILKIITAFTVAHSVTLLLAALEIIRVNSRFVECVIAFSICYVALENIFRKEVNYRWLITFGFGLIHGFGFASALKELIVGKSNLLLSVVSFNMGVEMGQLMLFFLMLPILYLLKKQIGFRTVTVGASAVVFVTGFAWLIERVFDMKLLWF